LHRFHRFFFFLGLVSCRCHTWVEPFDVLRSPPSFTSTSPFVGVRGTGRCGRCSRSKRGLDRRRESERRGSRAFGWDSIDVLLFLLHRLVAILGICTWIRHQERRPPHQHSRCDHTRRHHAQPSRFPRSNQVRRASHQRRTDKQDAVRLAPPRFERPDALRKVHVRHVGLSTRLVRGTNAYGKTRRNRML